MRGNPELPYASAAAVYRMGADVVYAQALTALQAWAVAADEEAARQELQAALAELHGSQRTWTLLQHLRDQTFATAKVQMQLSPPAQDPFWRRPLQLELEAFAFGHDGYRWTLVVPLLGLEYPADGKEPPFALLQGLLHRWLRRFLRRGRDLGQIARLAAALPGRLVAHAAAVPLRSPRDAARHDANRPSAIHHLNLLLSRQSSDHGAAAVVGLDAPAQRVADALVGGRSALLVGPSGVGKSLLVRHVAATRRARGLAQRDFRFGTGTRILALASRDRMDWQSAMLGLCEAAAGQADGHEVVLCLGSLDELLSIGPCVGSAVSMASVLAPYVQQRRVQCIVEATTDQWARIEREHPDLVQAFERIDVAAPEPETMLAVLRHAVGDDGEANSSSLRRLDRLFRRFAPYAGQPRAALRLLHEWRRDHPHERLDDAAVLAAFAGHTGIPTRLLDDAIPLDLAATRAFFAARVRHQDVAVDAVVARIAQWKADLARPDRPLASFLFLGPTGVGKTELAKALAEFLFGAKDRMVRFDMSEYGDPVALLRLVGGPRGEGQLTARMREQPFAVVLFDEFEKADSGFLDLLLQVLGEGRLTDVAGRTSWFQQAVVILTSNLGAEGFSPEGLAFGRRDVVVAARQHYEQALRRHLRPELWNRLDAWVPFQPLGEHAALDLTRLQIERLGRRPGIGGTLRLEVDDDVVRRIAVDGVDPRYGARPLQRQIDRTLIVGLANEMASVPLGQSPRLARFRLAEGGLRIELTAQSPDESAGTELQTAADIRRAARDLDASPAMRELRTRLEQARVGETKVKLEGRSTQEALDAALDARCRQLVAAVESLEEREFLATAAAAGALAATPARSAVPSATELQAELFELTCSLAELGESNPDRCWLWLSSTDAALLARFAEAYGALLGDGSTLIVEAHVVLPKRRGSEARMVKWTSSPQHLPPTSIKGCSADELAWIQQQGPRALLLHLRGPHAAMRFAQESGEHLWCDSRAAKKEVAILVRAMDKVSLAMPQAAWMATGRACRRNHAHRIYDVDADGSLFVDSSQGRVRCRLPECLRLLTMDSLFATARKQVFA